eukprot:TRINITY_DN40213_c0_g1_i1.p1 TRINITY_DN40213_c0_g1~~TRINITY_DN40213_c0_g1_i1.p1  ORF type:complete len:598 (+),score=75.00 TRINITY_DN40213_c0_g1_i1:69-1796(+)
MLFPPLSRALLLVVLLHDLRMVVVARKPAHILALLVDDYGWANAGWHVQGTPAAEEVRTPNMNALVKEGIELDRNYAFQLCAPSRAAIQSGRHPLHVNARNDDPIVYNPGDNISGFAGIPRRMTSIAELLKARAGYSTHFFGKWDCGMATKEHTPRGRGYDSSLSYFHHMNNHWTSSFENPNGNTNFFPACQKLLPNYRPVDLWIANDTYEGPAWGINNTLNCNPGDFDLCSAEQACPPYPGFPISQRSGCRYEDEVFLEALLAVIDEHDLAKPFFGFWAPHVAHSPLQVPKAYYDRFVHVQDWRRRRYLAMVSFIDTAVGQVIARLKARFMYENLLIVMSSDNGGPIYAKGAAGASNYPLRGGKGSNFEGGIRVNGFVSGGLVPPRMRSRMLPGLTTVWDWYATFAEVAGIPSVHDARAVAAGLPDVDSISQWPYWSGSTATPTRRELVIGDAGGARGVILDAGPRGLWKYLVGQVPMDALQGPSFPNASTGEFPSQHCGSGGCVWRLDEDPHELHDVASKVEPSLLQVWEAKRREAHATFFDPKRGLADAASCTTAVQQHGGCWGPWVDVPLE